MILVYRLAQSRSRHDDGRGHMSAPKRIKAVLLATVAVIAMSLTLGVGAASATPPALAAQSVGVISGGGTTLLFECHAAHIAQVPLASATTVSCYAEFSNGFRCYAATATRPGGYAGTGALCRGPNLTWQVCVSGSVLHGNGITDYAGPTCFPPTVRI
jgi:hypothetical protein